MATALTDNKPVIATVSGAHPNPEGEMDALLLGRTRVCLMFACLDGVLLLLRHGTVDIVVDFVRYCI